MWFYLFQKNKNPSRFLAGSLFSFAVMWDFFGCQVGKVNVGDGGSLLGCLLKVMVLKWPTAVYLKSVLREMLDHCCKTDLCIWC